MVITVFKTFDGFPECDCCTLVVLYLTNSWFELLLLLLIGCVELKLVCFSIIIDLYGGIVEFFNIVLPMLSRWYCLDSTELEVGNEPILDLTTFLVIFYNYYV